MTQPDDHLMMTSQQEGDTEGEPGWRQFKNMVTQTSMLEEGDSPLMLHLPYPFLFLQHTLVFSSITQVQTKEDLIGSDYGKDLGIRVSSDLSLKKTVH